MRASSGGSRRARSVRIDTRHFGVALASAIALFDAWAERRRQRLALRAMSDYMLRDMGISRADAETESVKPFWRD
ncbi:DUF1127 domain-containing protein [Arboricoccus pini]|uniref:DUF1127 domain-containing protein n=1 Tax=Arboricoccus pini TaxID=1963835 RepID=UPI000B509789|nr:DUF1127 domain-containing protein [Arboricoccus pini]